MKSRDPLIVRKLYRKQRGRCNAPCEDYIQRRGIFLPERLLECDHIDSKGPDGIENRQLLCSHCNRVKREHSMEYLVDYHRTRWEMEQMRRNQLALISPERVVKKERVVQQPVPQSPQRQHRSKYRGPGLVACMTGFLLCSCWYSIKR